MTLKVAINGFGRMGRLFLRSIFAQPEFEVIRINDPKASADCSAHLLAFDSIHGKFKADSIQAEQDAIVIEGQSIHYSQEAQLAKTHWQQVDLLIEASGCYRKTSDFEPLFQQGVKKVLVACPVKDGDTLNIAYGVNQQDYQHQKHHLVTAASCTTNCLAPVIKVLLDNFGIQQGAMTTIHDVTNTQRIIDSAHNDLRRARACNESLIPTTSGSTTAIMKIFPELQGKLNGLAVRVPILNASIVDLVVKLNRPVSVAEVNDAFEIAANGQLRGILGFETRPLVSVDYKGDTRSAIIDAQSTQVTNGDLVKIIAWYDNEMNYVSRMKDIALMIARHD